MSLGAPHFLPVSGAAETGGPYSGRGRARVDPVRRRRDLVAGARRATLATIAPDGRPRLVPVCHVVLDDGDERGRTCLYSPLDAKPKRTADPRRLARVRDLLARPAVTVLVDRWDEDWSRLRWVRLEGRGDLLEAGRGDPRARSRRRGARTKYPQYLAHGLADRPLIRIVIERVVAWGDLGPA
jgi:PPOX class probable F420-dependent enzyme